MKHKLMFIFMAVFVAVMSVLTAMAMFEAWLR